MNVNFLVYAMVIESASIGIANTGEN